ncbi:D-serine ammonia-lyase, partial [Lecanoromycetidae sp. Uapishka_2]
MASASKDLFPCPSKQILEKTFVGKKLSEVSTPAAVLDRAVVGRNCQQMLKACKALNVGFRPHVKTHKTTEVTLLQLGEGVQDVKILVSTIAEAEHLSSTLHEFHRQGKSVNVLYGVPLPPSQVQRLADLRNLIGPYSISVIIDHPAQLQVSTTFKEATGAPLQAFVKVDTGYHRAGLDYTTKSFGDLIKEILQLQIDGFVVLAGFYSHDDDGLHAHGLHGDSQPRYILSVGATPTATSVENMRFEGAPTSQEGLFNEAKALIYEVNQHYALELHAGVYPILDMQQLATHASPSAAPSNPAISTDSSLKISTADLALTILAEVISIYDERHSPEGGVVPEALVAAGTLALGHDACKSYKGWGIVSNWGMKRADQIEQNQEGRSGWQVGRISQEHGILTEDTMISGTFTLPLTIGQKIRIWPNHACIAGAGYGWYLVVDSRLQGDRQEEIVDVWVRCRGW